jgi:hypothetical protein
MHNRNFHHHPTPLYASRRSIARISFTPQGAAIALISLAAFGILS